MPHQMLPSVTRGGWDGKCLCRLGSNVARPGVDAGEQESLLAEWCELGNNFGERKVESAWPGKATGRDTVNAMISMGTDFLVGTTVRWFELRRVPKGIGSAPTAR